MIKQKKWADAHLIQLHNKYFKTFYSCFNKLIGTTIYNYKMIKNGK